MSAGLPACSQLLICFHGCILGSGLGWCPWQSGKEWKELLVAKTAVARGDGKLCSFIHGPSLGERKPFTKYFIIAGVGRPADIVPVGAGLPLGPSSPRLGR